MLNQSLDSTDFSLIVDAGGFLKRYGSTAQIQTDYLLKGLSMLNYDCFNLAIKDFSEGGEFIKKEAEKHNIDFISANIVYSENGKNFVQPYLIKTMTPVRSRSHARPPFKKLKIALFGLCDQKDALLHKKSTEAALKSENPIEAARKIAPQLKKKADIVVLLFAGRYNALLSILKEVDDVDIVIMGGSEYYRAENYTDSSVVVTSAPSLGKYFGLLTVELDRDKNIISTQKKRIALDKRVKDDPHFVKLVSDFEKVKKEYIKNNKQHHNRLQ